MTIAQNLAAVEARIDKACERAGRDRSEVRLLPVSKTHPVARIREAAAAGYRLFGENRVQEVVAKTDELETSDEFGFAVIGHLQTNKARQVVDLVRAGRVSEFHALDSLRLAAELDKRLQTAGCQLDVFVQVNSSAEPQKFGVPVDEVAAFVDGLAAFDALRVRGLMTLAVFSEDEAQVAACFERMRTVQRELQQRQALGLEWRELSMGMSGDFELAIAHGATTVRVGQAIFGARLDPNAYWPA